MKGRVLQRTLTKREIHDGSMLGKLFSLFCYKTFFLSNIAHKSKIKWDEHKIKYISVIENKLNFLRLVLKL